MNRPVIRLEPASNPIPIRRFANHRFKGTSMAAHDDDQKPDTKDDDHSLDMSQWKGGQ